MDDRESLHKRLCDISTTLAWSLIDGVKKSAEVYGGDVESSVISSTSNIKENRIDVRIIIELGKE